MRCLTGSDIKASAVGKKKRGLPTRLDPPEGTRNRLLWDRLQANRGVFVSIADLFEGNANFTRDSASYRRYLTDFWGLDIAYKPKGIWCLVGEWKGKEYVDYLAEKYK